MRLSAVAAWMTGSEILMNVALVFILLRATR